MAYILPSKRRLSTEEDFFIGDDHYGGAVLLVPGACERLGIEIVPDTLEEAQARRAKAYALECDPIQSAARAYEHLGRDSSALWDQWSAKRAEIALRLPKPQEV